MRSARVPALLALVAACAPAPALAPVPAAPGPPVLVVPGPPLIGAPVVVSQRLPALSSLAELSPTGKLVMVGGHDGVHLVDAETGVTRGALAGCAGYVVFAPDGRSVVAACEETKTARIWDLGADTTRQLALSHTPTGLVSYRAGDRVAALRDGGADVIDVARGTVLALETGSRQPPRIVVMPASGWIAIADGKTVSVRDAAGKVVGAVPTDHEATAFDLGLSGKRLAIADEGTLSIVDVETGAARVKVSPCGEGVLGEVAWSDDELHLVVACGARGAKAAARVVVLAADGAEERVLIETPTSAFTLLPSGDRVAVGHPAEGAAVFEIATGKELLRLAPPWEGARRVRFSRDLERVAFREGNAVGSVTVIDRAAGRLGLHLEPSAEKMTLAKTGELLELQGRKGHVYVDLAQREVLRDLPGELGPDGRTVLPLAEGREGFELVDRLTGARRRVAVHLDDRPPGPSFSDHGAYVVVPEVKPAGDDGGVDYRLRLFDTKTLKATPPLSFGAAQLNWSFNADDSRVAMLAAVGHTRTGQPCTDGHVELDCLAVRVFDTRTGRPIATIQPDDLTVDGIDFTPDGGHVILGGGVYDVRTARVKWRFGARVRVVHLPPRRVLLLDPKEGVLVVDAPSGKVVTDLEHFDDVRAVTDDGAWMLTTRGGEVSLWETATWTKRPTSLRLPPKGGVVLAPDGRLAYLVEGADLVIHRFADGRALRRALPGLGFDVTDEGVFEAAQAGSGAALVRTGPDVERSPMGPLSLVIERLGHAGLVADFVAGKSVAPR